MARPRLLKPLITACSGCEGEIVLEDEKLLGPGERIWHAECMPPLAPPERPRRPERNRRMELRAKGRKRSRARSNDPLPPAPPPPKKPKRKRKKAA